MKQKHRLAMYAALFGLWLSLCYVNPYGGKIALSQFVLQLSGSRGEFALGVSMQELVAFTLRLIPCFVYEALIGTSLYQYYCTASVFVFTRIPHRLQWYKKEVCSIILFTFFYQFVLLAASLLTTAVRYSISFDLAGWLLLIIHFCLYSIWMIMITLWINLVAIYRGSSAAFLLLTGVQTVFICLFSLARSMQNNEALKSAFLRADPVSCLVLGWHSSRIASLSQALAPPCSGLFLEDSLIFVCAGCLAALLIGELVIQRHDLIIAGEDTGG